MVSALIPIGEVHMGEIGGHYLVTSIHNYPTVRYSTEAKMYYSSAQMGRVDLPDCRPTSGVESSSPLPQVHITIHSAIQSLQYLIRTNHLDVPRTIFQETQAPFCLIRPHWRIWFLVICGPPKCTYQKRKQFCDPIPMSYKTV